MLLRCGQGFKLQNQDSGEGLQLHVFTVELDNTRLVKLAMVSGCALGADQAVTAANKTWQCHVETFLACHSQQLKNLYKFDIIITSVVERKKH